MIEISFEIGGRKVSPDRIGDVLVKNMLKQITAKIKKALSSVSCAEHGGVPKVKVKGKDIDNLSFEVEGCCKSLIDNALKKLSD